MNANKQNTQAGASDPCLKTISPDLEGAQRSDAHFTNPVTFTGLSLFRRRIRGATGAALIAVAPALLCGCQLLTYTSPNGERFARVAFGAKTAVAKLAIETGTNGVRHVELRGYASDNTEALGTVTEAAVRAAIGTPK